MNEYLSFYFIPSDICLQEKYGAFENEFCGFDIKSKKLQNDSLVAMATYYNDGMLILSVLLTRKIPIFAANHSVGRPGHKLL